MKRSLALLALLSMPLFAQDPAPRAEPNPKTLLTDAILHFRSAGERIVQANVEHARPDGGGGFGVAIQVGFGGSRGTPFEGRVEAWRGRDGVTVIVSEERLPGFKLYIDGDTRVQQATFQKQAPNLSQLQYELASLLDTERFVKHMVAAQGSGRLKTSVDVDTGDVTFLGPIDTEVVVPVDTAANVPGNVPPEVVDKMFPRNRILEAEATFVVTRGGRFKSIAIKVTRNDTQQEMMRKVGKGGGRIVIGGLGGGAPPPPQGKKKDDKDKPIRGGSTTYTLTFAGQPSETAQAFKKAVAAMIK